MFDLFKSFFPCPSPDVSDANLILESKLFTLAPFIEILLCLCTVSNMHSLQQELVVHASRSKSLCDCELWANFYLLASVDLKVEHSKEDCLQVLQSTLNPSAQLIDHKVYEIKFFHPITTHQKPSDCHQAVKFRCISTGRSPKVRDEGLMRANRILGRF